MRYTISERTPEALRCGIGACPAIYEAQLAVTSYNTETRMRHKVKAAPSDSFYLIIGSVADPNEYGLKDRVGVGEILIRVSKQLIDERVSGLEKTVKTS